MNKEVQSILVKFGVKKVDMDALQNALTQARCIIYKSELPSLTQQPIEYVDATPDADYPTRILQAHRYNCDCLFVDGTDEPDTQNPLLKLMNEHNAKRARILDKAIAVLQPARLEGDLD